MRILSGVYFTRALSEKGVRLAQPKRCKLTRAFPWEYSDKRLELAQLLDRHGVFLTFAAFTFAGSWSSDLGFGRIFVSEIQAPIILAHLV
jgi:hypothetical protein